MRSVATLMIGILVFLVGGVSVARAQGAVGGFLTVNFGALQPVSKTFDMKASEAGATADATYSVKRAPIFDVAGGVLLGRRFGVGVGVSRNSDNQPATVSLTLPVSATRTLSASKSSDPLERSETALHIQLIYQLEASPSVNVMVFGGPSHFSAKQKLVSDFDAVPIGPILPGFIPSGIAISGLQIEQHDASAWGFNVGADVGFMIVKSFGVGALVRYSRATVALPNLFQMQIVNRTVNQDVDVGGLTVGGGVRVRF